MEQILLAVIALAVAAMLAERFYARCRSHRNIIERLHKYCPAPNADIKTM